MKYILQSEPLVSIMIPNKDHIEDLDRCIQSIENKCTYKNIEYIIIENNSTEEETFAYYKKLENENPKAKVVYWKGEFNYSAINNFGRGYAKETICCFLIMILRLLMKMISKNFWDSACDQMWEQ